MLFPETRSSKWPTFGVIAVYMLVLIAAIDASRMIVPANHTMHEAMREPWPTLLSAEPARTDSDVAVLQLRASGTLARLIEAGRTAE